MIGRLKGVVTSIGDDGVLLDVGGVGYEVFCHPRLQAQLAPGEAATLIIDTHVREDHIHLFGFASAEEREWFRRLSTVQRVGNKAALAILNALPPDALRHAILAKDTTAFSRISGIGPKLAERIVGELKDKVVGGTWQVESKKESLATSHQPPTTILEDIISALTHLGYGRSEAYTAASAACQEDATASLDTLIKRSLKELA